MEQLQVPHRKPCQRLGELIRQQQDTFSSWSLWELTGCVLGLEDTDQSSALAADKLGNLWQWLSAQEGTK